MTFVQRKAILASAILCSSIGAMFLVTRGPTDESRYHSKYGAGAEASGTWSTKKEKEVQGARPSLEGSGEFKAQLQKKMGVVRQELLLLGQLRQLKFSDPERSIRLAERLEQSFADSESSPERAWYQARNLVVLKRFDEAQQIARQMHEERPDDPWSQDLRRHLLSHPFGLPHREH